eukprot:COSAG01_NODE_71978_length_254_cov_0.670968_1_plen_75_part_01
MNPPSQMTEITIHLEWCGNGGGVSPDVARQARAADAPSRVSRAAQGVQKSRGGAQADKIDYQPAPDADASASASA